MAGSDRLTTVVSDGVPLKQVVLFPVTRPEDVFGCLNYKGKAKTVEEMAAGIIAEAWRCHAGDSTTVGVGGEGPDRS
jgi:hypothetical protein